MKNLLNGVMLAAAVFCTASSAESSGADDICWRDLYFRGVGTIEAECAAGQERSIGLCYDPCKQGFNGIGPMCYAPCPAGEPIAAGPLCCFSTQECTDKVVQLALQFPIDIIKAIRDRENIDQVIQDLKKAIEDAIGFKMPTCPAATFEQLLRSEHKQTAMKWAQLYASIEREVQVAAQELAAEMPHATDKDVCWRDMYLRGIGRVAETCVDGEEKSLGMCYKVCQPGFNGEGPLCYAPCSGAEAVEAGPICCADFGSCSKKAIQLGVMLPYELIKAYEDRLNPLKVLDDLRKAINDAMGFEMPTCPAPSMSKTFLRLG